MPSDRFFSHLSSSLPDAWLRRVGRLNVPVYRLTRGRLMGRIGRAPVLLLTTTGRRSGEPRTAPVVFSRDGDDLVVVGSNAGNTRVPAWALNLRAHPAAEVQVRGERRGVRARVSEGAERERLWRLVNEDYAGFDDYKELTDREIGVFVLEPALKGSDG